MLVFVVYNRRREAQIKYPGPDDDIRENIINYEDEGGGEDDMTAFDITPLQGWKFMSCSHCQEVGQQASWPLIGCTRVNVQLEARSAS